MNWNPETPSFIASRYTNHATPDSYINNHLLVQQSPSWMELHVSQSSVKYSSTLYSRQFLGLKRPGRGIDHLPLSSTEVKERVFPLWVFVACSRVKFTFTFIRNVLIQHLFTTCTPVCINKNRKLHSTSLVHTFSECIYYYSACCIWLMIIYCRYKPTVIKLSRYGYHTAQIVKLFFLVH
jgi:hypothetical protein